MRINYNCLLRKARYLLCILLYLPVALIAQTGTREIKGTVKNERGEGISAATVTVKGTNRAQASDAAGNFTINATTGETLVITAVSFGAIELPVTAENFYDVSLTAASGQLNEVVVVGYGKSNRKTLISSITTVKPGDLNRGAIGDVGQLLQGKVPGLNITASGDPNRPAAVILRGAATINSPGAPFYVIDGVPGADIATVAPDDIASLDVLKDASATAIYGNRAAGGVIIITTKRGRRGQSQTSYNGYVGLEKVSNRLALMDATQLRDYLTTNGSAFSPNDDKGVNTDWQKAIQRNGAISHNHNLSFSGGGEHSTYSATVNYFDKEGILTRSKLRRVIARLNVEQMALNDKLKFGLNVANSNSNSNYVPLQNIVLLQSAKHLPVSPVRNPDGSYFENLNTTGYFNPIAMVDNALDDTKYNSLIANFTAEAKLPFGLTYNGSFSYQRTSALHGEYYGSYYGIYPTSNFYNNPDPGIGIAHTLIGNLFGRNGAAIRNTYQNTTATIESYLTWNRKFGEHSVNLVAGYSWQQNENGDGFQTSTTNFIADNTGYQNLVLGNPYALSSYRVNFGNDRTYGKILLISDFGRLNYSFKDRYLVQASLRRDGSSVFGKNNRWGYFPSAGIGWRIIEEGFMSKQSLFSDLKVRASYGVTGNSGGIGPYTSQLLYGITGTYYNNGVQENAYGPTQGANPDLQWEKVATTNIGLDFSLLKGKLSGTFDWYNKNTTGMLFGYAVPAALVPGGFLNANGGSINNKGVEFSLTATPVSGKNFNWTSTINLAHNKNLITSLKGPISNADSIRYSDPEGPGQTNATLQLLKVGYPIGQFFTLSYAGKDANGVSQFNKRDGSKTSGAQTPAIGTDYWYMGNAQPKLLAGWNNTIRYHNFDLNFFLRGVFGNKIFNATRADLSFVSAATANNILLSAKDDKLNDTKNSFYSNRYIENGSYIRLDNATLSYNFTKPVNYVNSIRVYATVNNLFTITDYSGIDPEINQGGAAPGIDYNNFYPKTRTFLFGFSVSL